MSDQNALKNNSKPSTSHKYYRDSKNAPINDLREVLVRKQKEKVHKTDPPPDPKYNFLSDPLRENDYGQSVKDERRYEGESSGFTHRENPMTYDTRYFRHSRGEQGYHRDRGYRGPMRGKSRGRRSGDFYNEEHQREQMEGQLNTSATSKSSDTDLEKHVDSMRTLENHNRGNVRRSYPENSEHSAPRRGRGYYPGRGSYQDRGSYSRGNSRFHRGYDNQRYNNQKKLNPMNIKVEFNVETNEHKYVFEKDDKENVKVRSPRGRRKRGAANMPQQTNKQSEDSKDGKETEEKQGNDSKIEEKVESKDELNRQNVVEEQKKVENEGNAKLNLSVSQHAETPKIKIKNENNLQSDSEISDENLREDDLSSIDWGDSRQSNDDDDGDNRSNRTHKKTTRGKNKSLEERHLDNSSSSREDLF